MDFPAGYEWLGSVGTLPKMIAQALNLYGTHEITGKANNPAIMGWAAEVGVQAEYTADEVPWCGLFMGVVARRAGYAFPTHPLWALNWRNFGTAEAQPLLGDVLVFVRDGGGHVGLYIGEDRGTKARPAAYHVLGGNSSNQVKIVPIDKKRLVAARAPMYQIGRPASSKPYVLSATGKLSTNEA